jgi:hypothetical protein
MCVKLQKISSNSWIVICSMNLNPYSIQLIKEEVNIENRVVWYNGDDIYIYIYIWTSPHSRNTTNFIVIFLSQFNTLSCVKEEQKYTHDQNAMDVFASEQHIVCLNPNIVQTLRYYAQFGKCTWKFYSILVLKINIINGSMPELHVNFSSLGVSRFCREHKTKGLGFF